MQVSASSEPSGIAAASSNVSAAGFRAMTPLSGTITYSAFAPPLMPNTSSPTWSSVTPAPTLSTLPANSVPRLVRLGRRMPIKRRGEALLDAAHAHRVAARHRGGVNPDEHLVVLRRGTLYFGDT